MQLQNAITNKCTGPSCYFVSVQFKASDFPISLERLWPYLMTTALGNIIGKTNIKENTQPMEVCEKQHLNYLNLHCVFVVFFEFVFVLVNVVTTLWLSLLLSSHLPFYFSQSCQCGCLHCGCHCVIVPKMHKEQVKQPNKCRATVCQTLGVTLEN